jgi:hypothetical protein
MIYPDCFVNKDGTCPKLKSNNHTSFDGSPRYIPNPKCPDNTYCLKDCMERWIPVYHYFAEPSELVLKQ